MTSLREQLEALLAAVLKTEPEEIDCDEFLSHASRLMEALDAGEPLPAELEIVSQHLSVCPECRQEFEALVRAIDSR